MDSTTKEIAVDKLKILQVDPHIEDAKQLVAKLDEYHKSLYPDESNHLDTITELSAQNVTFVVAYFANIAVGCGAVKVIDNHYGEIKRVYVLPSARGKGIAKAVMIYLENSIVTKGIKIARLETGIHQMEAIGLYEKLGYKRIAPFGKYTHDPLSVFMEKNFEE